MRSVNIDNKTRTEGKRGLKSPKIIIAATTVVILWASAFVAVQAALADISPGQLALARYIVASISFLGIILVRKPPAPKPRDLVRLAVAGGVGISLYNLSLNYGQTTVKAGVASMLVNTVPIWTCLLSSIFLKERISRVGWTGTTIAFAGVSMIGLHRSGWTGFETGTLYILAAAVSQSLFFVIVKPLLERFHPIDVTAYVVWFGCLFLLPFSSGLSDNIKQSSFATQLLIVFLGVGPTTLAYVAWSYVLAAQPAGSASNVLFLVPVAAIILGWLILNDLPSTVSILGGVIAIFGILLGKGAFSFSRQPHFKR